MPKSSTRISAALASLGALCYRHGKNSPGTRRSPGRTDTLNSYSEIRSTKITTTVDPADIEQWAEAMRSEAEKAGESAAASELEAIRREAQLANEAAAKRIEEIARSRRSATPSNPCDTQEVIGEVCDEIRDFLIDKNAQYGDSAINPVRIFSQASPVEQLFVRIDDKLSRISRGDDRIESDDDVVDDLIGYLILLKVAKRKDERASYA
jgi:hypothetical protein